MSCIKQISHPQTKDCQQCEYRSFCKIESIIDSANDISNIHTESAKSVLNKIDNFDKKAEQKIGQLWNCIVAVFFTIILGIILTIISYICNGYV